MEGTCTLCGVEDKELTHLKLYVAGSEGADVCLACRMILTEVARGIKQATARAHISALKERKHATTR